MQDARPGEARDAIDGIVPRLVARPASADAVARTLGEARAEALAVIPKGGGSKLGWGMPPRRADLVLETTGLDRVLEHAAQDLVVRAEAGVRLAALQQRLAESGQRLSLDAPEPNATLGGVVAAAASGPLRHRYGAPRDLLLGITVALADGTLAKAGGKVVKNVAGYDLGKLFAGSLGTLGVIVELTFRLHPLPEDEAWTIATLPDAAATARAVQALLRSSLVPSALELTWRADEPLRLGALFEGRAPGVAAQTRSAVELLGSHGSTTIARDAGFEPRPPAQDLLLHVAVPPAELAFALDALRQAAAERRLLWSVDGRAGLGVLDAGFAGGDESAYASLVADLRTRVLARGGSVVIRRAAAELRRRADVFGEPGDTLSLLRRVKQSFDAAATLSPGRFVGGL
jgi:glycolate oxidase FAD binding subunit